MSSPIIIFSYNRPSHLNNLIISLIKNKVSKSTKIFFFCDGPKNNTDKKKINEIKDLLYKTNLKIHFKNFRKKNIGLANNIIDGVSYVMSKYKSCIVLEDDLVLNKNCINYMNIMLARFKMNNKIGSVSAYSYIDNFKSNIKFDFYLSKRHSSWCWGTWSRVWNKIEWKNTKLRNHFSNKLSLEKFAEGGNDLNLLLWGNKQKLINSWAILFNFYCANSSLKSIQPRFSMIKNDGRDFSGTHEKFSFKANKKFSFNPYLGSIKNIHKRVVERKDIYSYIKNTHRRSFKIGLKFFTKYFKII
jgi:hypothetical protein